MARFDCAVCDGEADLEYYTSKATGEEVATILMHVKLCVKDARKISEANTKKEIERTVA